MPVIGLDLGDHTFRAVEMDEQRERNYLKKYGNYRNNSLNLYSSSQNDLDEYAAELKHFFAENNFSTPESVISLPESEVFTRVVKMPKMSEKDLRNSITYEAEQYIPIPLDQVNFDFQILDESFEDKDKMNVLIVAAKKSIVDKYVKILRKAGIVPVAFEPESLAVSRVLCGSVNKPTATILLHIGSTASQIVISYRGFIRFTRSVAIGGNDLTKAVENKLGFDHNQAVEYKQTYGLDVTEGEGKVAGALKPVFNKILEEVKRSEVFYTTHHPNVSINRVVVAGGTAQMPGLLFYIANKLNLEAELSNPWRNIEFAKPLQNKKEEIMSLGPQFVTSVGLALKGLE